MEDYIEWKPLVRVYRIEHKMYGGGVYRNNAVSLSNCDDYYIEHDKHPAPEDDGMLKRALDEKNMINHYGNLRYSVTVDYSFGFSSLEQLRSWFYKDSWIEWMSENDFIVAVCDVPYSDVLIGYTQAMFIKPDEYDKVDILELLNIK